MIAAIDARTVTSARPSAHVAPRRRQPCAREPRCGCHACAAPAPCRSPGPDPRMLAGGLFDLVCDGRPVRAPGFVRAGETARAFAAGSGYLPGLIVDRSA